MVLPACAVANRDHSEPDTTALGHATANPIQLNSLSYIYQTDRAWDICPSIRYRANVLRFACSVSHVPDVYALSIVDNVVSEYILDDENVR